MLLWLRVFSVLGLGVWGDSPWDATRAKRMSEGLRYLFGNITQLIEKGKLGVNDVSTVVSRKEWGAEAVGCGTHLTSPVNFLVMHHVPGLECHNQTVCSQRLRELQAHHVHNNSWCDVAYNFLVGDDGRVYEGIGWDIQGMHTQGYNNISLGFAFFGTKEACPYIVPRSDWEARETHCPKMNLPAKYVIIIHTSGRVCNMSDECRLLVQDIQSLLMDRFNSCDIGYNFLVGQDGVLYEGVGWNVQGSHTAGYNDIALGIAFMGTFSGTAPNAAALEAAQNLIQCAVDEGYLDPNYLLVAQSDLIKTLSPGQALYNIISSWPHFKH
ncbi:peptidoglycan recognition protein 4 isoform X3 [Equus asinus]|uniref:peptidoglycan recognition protein 4-like isoform X3 n=1 Tax=Equus quagga TaxID=89248 RepID=UPI001D03F235|nr:peptidoglycan recognition protein 4 isoform X3 [Equus asinus]XP_046505975.1 peptidoglycan recognition protein 4-like isoform X3 [Equus quagga]XP_046505979.1 peptidoglycan recognition protein 4-like isoform X3 [Equus quagga]